MRNAIVAAISAAEKSDAKYKVGCAIYSSAKKNHYLGWSSMKSHPLQSKYADNPEKIYLHAEISALAKIRDADYSLDMAVIARKIKVGIAVSAPCDSCVRALIEFGVKSVLYYKNNNWLHAELIMRES